MRRWPSTIAIALGVCLGSGIGYAVALVMSVTSTPLITLPAGNSFDQVFLGMGRLGAFEILAANCNSRSDMPSVLSNEAELIRGINGAAKADGLNPPTDVAEAMLAIRNAAESHKSVNPQVQVRQESEAQNFLKDAGWKEQTAAHMEGVIAAIDENQCQQPSLSGAEPR